MMFDGLTSRWITPFWWAKASASQLRKSVLSARVWFHPSAPVLAISMTSANVCPRTSFIVK